MEFQEKILYHPSIIDPNDLLIFILFGDNVFTIALLTAMSVRTVSAKVVLYPYRMQYIVDDYKPHCVKRSLACKFVWSSNEWMTCEFGNLCRNFFGKVS